MNDKNNILILSAGRRVGLLKAFQAEILYSGMEALVFAADAQPHYSSACQFADKAFQLPLVSDLEYLDTLRELCEKNKIGLIIPTIDDELHTLTSAKRHFAAAGINIVISDSDLIASCRDKRLTSELFNSLNIANPQILDREKLTFPCFAKPYDGSGSAGAQKLDTPSDLTHRLVTNKKLIFTEFIDDTFDEYTIDAYFDKQNSLKCLVPRHRLEVRAGEVSKCITRKGAVYDYLIDKLKYLRGACGCLTIQLFSHPKNDVICAFEINPRFGGGYPLSYSAGANYPAWIISEYLLGKEIKFFDSWKPDLLMLRFDAHTLIENAN